MNRKLLTIIIAAYNKENCIRRCLDSIMDERVMDDVEVLVVNDGSKDDTLKIAREYEKRFPNYYHVIDKENGNYGSVMNVGLELAKGKYFRTLDADDWYNTEAYVHFVKDLNESDADLIISDGIIHYEQDEHESKMHFDDSLTKKQDMEVFPKLSSNKSLRSWTKVQTMVFKTQLLRDSGLRWLEKIFYTDTQYCYWPLRLVKTIRIVPYPVYVYLVGTDEQSMSPENVKRNYSHFFAVAEVMVEDFKKNYDAHHPLLWLQEKFVLQILGCVYSILLSDDRQHLEQIVRLHKKVCEIPNMREKAEKTFSLCGVSYIKGLDHGHIHLTNIKTYLIFKKSKNIIREITELL